MKIIVNGRKNLTARMECHICHSVLEITEDDLLKHVDCRPDESFCYVVCPVCGCYIEVPNNAFRWIHP